MHAIRLNHVYSPGERDHLRRIEQNSAEWRRWRVHFCGGSDAASHAGLDPYTKYSDMLRKRLGFIVPDNYDSPNFVHGHTTEPVAADYFTVCTGKQLRTIGIVVPLDPQLSFLGVSPDREVPAEGVLMEIKCPIRGLYESIPRYYLAQCQAQMGAYGCTWMYFWAFWKGTARLWKVRFDPSFFRALCGRMRTFVSLGHALEKRPAIRDARAAGLKWNDAERLPVLWENVRRLTERPNPEPLPIDDNMVEFIADYGIEK